MNELKQKMIDFLSQEWIDDKLDLHPHPRDGNYSYTKLAELVDENYKGGLRLFMLDFFQDVKD